MSENEAQQQDEFRTPPRQTTNSISLDPNLAWATIQNSQQFVQVPVIASHDSTWKLDSQSTNTCTRIVCMSDTHGLHRDISVPPGDVFIHAGDFTQTGEVHLIEDLVDYIRAQNFSHNICIAGNHDMTLDREYYERSWGRFHRTKLNINQAEQCMDDFENASTNKKQFRYLRDSGYVMPITASGIPVSSTSHNSNQAEEISSSSLSIYGSPFSPEFCDWAFNTSRGSQSREIWSKIPTQTDILVTHGPPLGRGDLCAHGGRAGCYDLLQEVQERIQPRVMIYGHIHEGYGASYDGTTLFVNASNLDLEYDNIHPCTVIDLPHDPTKPPQLVQPTNCDIIDLISWFRTEGYLHLADALDKVSTKMDCSTGLPSKKKLLNTKDAYKSLVDVFVHFDCFQTRKDISRAKKDLRKALLQIYTDSF